MNFIIIFGPQAVGKMTVGQELEKITDLKLFHNHMTIELVHPFVNYGTAEGQYIVKNFRNEIFKAVATGDSAGIIFTYLWDFESISDADYIEEISNLFFKNGASVYLVELEAETEVRVERNKTEHRLSHKPSKRDIEWSENNLLDTLSRCRFNSRKGEIKNHNHIRINNTNIEPEKVAQIVKEHFNL